MQCDFLMCANCGESRLLWRITMDQHSQFWALLWFVVCTLDSRIWKLTLGTKIEEYDANPPSFIKNCGEFQLAYKLQVFYGDCIFKLYVAYILLHETMVEGGFSRNTYPVVQNVLANFIFRWHRVDLSSIWN